MYFKGKVVSLLKISETLKDLWKFILRQSLWALFAVSTNSKCLQYCIWTALVSIPHQYIARNTH